MVRRTGSNVSGIPGVWQDGLGIIHTPHGAFNPVTGEGLPIDAPEDLMRKILIALIKDGEESGPAEPFEWDKLTERKFGG